MNEAIKALVGLEPEFSHYAARGIGINITVAELHIILAAIEALKPIAEGTHVGCKLAWKQGFCYGEPEYYPPPVTSPAPSDEGVAEAVK